MSSRLSLDYLDTHFDQFITDLNECLSIPSISTLPAHNKDIIHCAEFVQQHMRDIGLLNIQSFNDYGNPIIYGDYIVDDSLPTILFYGHYDVQPVDPLNLWEIPPFEPAIRDGYIFARGASDNKGMFFAHLKAIESYLKSSGSLPVNVKFIIEGEEEIGSDCMFPFLDDHKELLANDAIAVSDNPMFSENQPSVCINLRGLIYLEVTIKSMNYDVHSGQLGGSVPNIIHYVSTLIADMKDPYTNKVTIPGFYDDVIEFASFDASLPVAKDQLDYLNAHYNLGDHANSSFFDNIWFQPTLDCNGIISGFTDEGAKTVVPNSLTLKLSCRLVPNQDPRKMIDLVSNFIRSKLPESFDVSINDFNTLASPLLTDINSSFIQAAKTALKETHNKDVIVQGEGGSIPILKGFQDVFKTPIVLIGLNAPNDNIHAPNERFSIQHYRYGIETYIRFLDLI